jgi:hypothetical protein
LKDFLKDSYRNFSLSKKKHFDGIEKLFDLLEKDKSESLQIVKGKLLNTEVITYELVEVKRESLRDFLIK